MNKEEFTCVLESCLLLFDGMSEEEVKDLVGKKYVPCAKYINGFLGSYKLK